MLSYYTCSDIVSYALSSSATKCLLTDALRVTVPPSFFSSIWRTAHIMTLTLVIMKISLAFCYLHLARVRYFHPSVLLKHPTSMFFLNPYPTNVENSVCS